ncbi:hypothetical protein LSTR_LSTR004648 [Laodelphax striatellus]|uniref:Lipid droplet-regulating VLDL assembly factor AUP1 n=1 Tax=Laodelphax striatellus TaxID=195883 RepID=A0A482WVA1_LAOST|nr:hypothetical protein LSTR_LSTR004648 [Laodelphax striatellus]
MMEGSSTSQPDISNLFEKDRFPKKTWQLVTLLLYSPLGLSLAIVRLFILVQAFVAFLILPDMTYARTVFLRAIGIVLGVVLHRENENERDNSAKVIISNKITCLDNIAIYLTSGAITWDLPSPLAWALGVLDTTDGRKPIVSKIKSKLENHTDSFLLQPEEATTSGRVGLLKFAPWSAKVSDTMQPLVIQVWRPRAMETSADVLGASTFFNVFWFLFTPFTVFKLKYLPAISREPNESDEDLLGRIQSSIASELCVSATKHTAADKAEYEKLYLLECRRPVLVTGDPTALARPEIQRMVFQVAEVLPHVPMDVIIYDICRTHSIDLTISNILEGSIPFTPIPELRRAEPRQTPVPSRSSPPVVQSLSQGQGQMISFMERKAKLIADARRKYIEKHGLVDAWAE